MIVMPANNAARLIYRLAETYPGRIGHLYSPDGWRNPPDGFPYALDNGRYTAGPDWRSEDYLKMLERSTRQPRPPLWALVPDVPQDRDATLAEWDVWSTRIAAYGWPLAFALQDGMTPDDVPANADVVFLGGSTAWKRATLWDWCDAFPRVHVGRINTEKWLWECHEAGAESCDGTGWMRGDKRQLAGLLTYMKRSDQGKLAAQRQFRHLGTM